MFEVYFIFRCDHSLCSLFLFNNQSVNTTTWAISGSTKMLFLKQLKIQSASSVYFMNSSSQRRFDLTWKFKSLVEKFSKIFSSILKKAYQRKMLMYLFWKSRNLNVRNSKEKQTRFPTRIFHVKTRFLIPIHTQMLSSLFTNFLTGPSRLGHDCYKIVCSLLIEKLFHTSKLKISIFLSDFLTKKVIILAIVLCFFLSTTPSWTRYWSLKAKHSVSRR